MECTARLNVWSMYVEWPFQPKTLH